MNCSYKDSPEDIEAAHARNLDLGRKALVFRNEAGRYFVKFAGSKVITAWSVAGARLFIESDTYSVGITEKKLRSHRLAWGICDVEVVRERR